MRHAGPDPRFELNLAAGMRRPTSVEQLLECDSGELVSGPFASRHAPRPGNSVILAYSAVAGVYIPSVAELLQLHGKTWAGQIFDVAPAKAKLLCLSSNLESLLSFVADRVGLSVTR